MSRPWLSPLAGDRLLLVTGGDERTIARIRLAIIACVLAIPAFQALRAGRFTEQAAVGLGAAGAALLLALVLLVLAGRMRGHRWFPYLTVIVDVTMVSGALAVFVALGQPHTAVNSKVVWEIYLIAILAAALRSGRGVVLAATAAAVAEYLAILLWAYIGWDLNDPAFSPFVHGTFSWTAQISRLILLGACGLLALALVQRMARITQMAASDALTGALNRTFFEYRLEEEVLRARRHRRRLAIAMVDLDNLKNINDDLGHESGDQALVAVAQSLRAGLRASDSIFRYGGDEFAVLLPEARAEEARVRLARIATELRSRPIDGRSLTLSVGVAAAPADAGDSHGLLRIADENLYRAKRRGRDCIVASSKPAPQSIGQLDTRG